MIKVLHGELFVPNPERLEVLTTSWSSCVRFTYNRRLEGKEDNEIRRLAKPLYPQLNHRQVSDALLQSTMLFSRHKNHHRIENTNLFLVEKSCSNNLNQR